MNQYIDDIPIGSIVAVAVRDAANGNRDLNAMPEYRRGLDSLGGGGEGCTYGMYGKDKQ